MANLHTVAVSADLLGIRCAACGRRKLLGKEHLPIHRGNMTPLYALKFRCDGCGARNSGRPTDKVFALYIPFTDEEAKAFMEGADLENRNALR